MTDAPPADLATAREQFLSLIGALRPDLHRYCARLVGSAIDGEDVVQETLAKAFYHLSQAAELPPLRPWLFRIAHNTAIDFLRRYERRHVESMAEVPDVVDLDLRPIPSWCGPRCRASSRCRSASGARWCSRTSSACRSRRSRSSSRPACKR